MVPGEPVFHLFDKAHYQSTHPSTPYDNEQDIISATGDPVRDKFHDILDLALCLPECFDDEPTNSQELFASKPLHDSSPRHPPAVLEFAGEKRAEAERRFVKDREQDFMQVARGNENILHFLAKDGRLVKNRISLRWLAARIMAYYPHLMGQVDDQNRNPLSLAITERHDIFIRAYGGIGDIYSWKIREELRKELARSSPYLFETCLHLAMVSEISSESRKVIIGRTPAQLISWLSPAGVTPLHLAVDFNRCSTEQVGVIKYLFDVIPHDLVMKALNKRTYIPGSSAKHNLSAYQYHQYTRKMSHDQGEANSSANKIREILELKYLRNLDPASASRCLSLPGESCESHSSPVYEVSF